MLVKLVKAMMNPKQKVDPRELHSFIWAQEQFTRGMEDDARDMLHMLLEKLQECCDVSESCYEH